VTVLTGESSSVIVSVSSILILLTISPYNLFSISAVPAAVVPPPPGAEITTVGWTSYPTPPKYVPNSINSRVTT